MRSASSRRTLDTPKAINNDDYLLNLLQESLSVAPDELPVSTTKLDTLESEKKTSTLLIKALVQAEMEQCGAPIS